MKDLSWLRQEVQEQYEYYSSGHDTQAMAYEYVLDLIDQLEPTPSNSTGLEEVNEKLFEQAWEESAGKHIIKLESVYDILSQLEHPELPLIPEFVASILAYRNDEDESLFGIMQEVDKSYEGDMYVQIKEWINNGNEETFVRAWLDGYEVEEKKYKVLMGKAYEGVGLFLSKDPYEGVITLGSNLNYFYSEENNRTTHLTEKEIKGFKDGIYWPFAEEVTE